LTRIAKEILLSLEGGEITEELENALKEFCRSGGTDLPQIAGLMGGLIAQEAIKLVTKQYVPLNGTCIFNGIRSTTSVHNA
jgi:amyloid beta precursor protein binding protein 1